MEEVILVFLFQLSDFLETRVTELQDNSNVLSSNESMGGQGGGRDVTSDEAEGMMSDVNTILSQLTAGRLKDLLPIRSSPRLEFDIALIRILPGWFLDNVDCQSQNTEWQWLPVHVNDAWSKS